MKQKFLKLAFAAMLLFSVPSFSQGPDAVINTEFATKMNLAFSQLEKNRVPHKLLLDYAMEFTELSAYNGVITNENAVHIGTYKSIYNTLLMAQIQQGVPGMYRPSEFKSRWDQQRSANHIALSGLYYKYSKFKSDAVTANRLSVVSGKFVDKYVNGIWQNPYEEASVFSVAAPVMTVNARSFTVELPASLFYTNQQAAVSSVAVDFGTGAGYETITFDQNKTLNYTADGIYTWKFRLTLTNGQTLFSHTKIRVISVEVAQPRHVPCKTCPVPLNQTMTTLNFPMPTSVTATKAYNGLVGSASLQIRYAQGDGVIRKPLIVAEGFDPAFLEPENPLGMTSLLTFMTSVNPNPFSSTETGGLPDALSTYDIIYVNWNNGLDYIQRNAYVLEEVIKLVNQHKQTTEKNVVLGQSMGGLVARYALKDMENFSLAHDTKLYVSHDSPHLGANIPISYQHLDRHVYNQFIQSPLLADLVVSVADDAAVLYDVQTMFDAPATRQMLINYVKGNHVIDNSWHITWQNELTAMGYPAQTRNVAISNGSHCGSLQNFAPGSRLFSLNGSIRTGWLADLVLTAFPLANTILWAGVATLTYEPPFLLGILPGNNKISIDFWANALPASGVQQIYKGKITYTKKLLWLIDINVTVTDKTANSPTGILPYDSYPGGFYSIPIDFTDVSYSNMFVSMNITGQLNSTFNFIPTPSALDVGKGLITLNNADYLAGYTAAAPPAAPRTIPFVNFITAYATIGGQAASANTEHITFNRLNGNWLTTELDNNQLNNMVFDCTKFCAGTEITGDWLLCTSETYSVTSQATSASWWISEGSNLVTLTANGTTATLVPAITNASGYVTLNVTYSNATCGTATASKRIYLGRPTLVNSNITGGYDNIAIYDTTQFNITPAVAATSYRWMINGGNCSGVTNATPATFANGETVMITNTTYAIVHWGNCPGNYSVSCRAVNDCAFTAYQTKNVQLFQPGGSGDPCDDGPFLKVYPNPVSSGNISARMIPYPGEPCNDPEFERQVPINNQVKIYDMLGNQLYDGNFTTDDIDITGLNLKKGSYILNVTTSKGKMKREVVIVN